MERRRSRGQISCGWAWDSKSGTLLPGLSGPRVRALVVEEDADGR
jgi:hypothetical protein